MASRKTVKYLTAFLLFFVLPKTKAQDNVWELPVKNGLIDFEYAREFQNKKKELCLYYTNNKLQVELGQKIRGELSANADKKFNSSDYTIIFRPYNVDASYTNRKFVKCNPNENDTLYGALTIIMCNKPMRLSSSKNSFNLVKCSVKIIFTGLDKYTLKFRGFSLSGMNNLSVPATEEYLEDVYTKFKSVSDKPKADILFYRDLKGLIYLFQNILGNELERNIKINEQD
jgi:hypothetical protein